MVDGGAWSTEFPKANALDVTSHSSLNSKRLAIGAKNMIVRNRSVSFAGQNDLRSLLRFTRSRPVASHRNPLNDKVDS